MPIDGQSTRQRRNEPTSPPEADSRGAEGEFGVPPTQKRTPAMPPPTSKPPPPTPPASFASKVDAEAKARARPVTAQFKIPVVAAYT